MYPVPIIINSYIIWCGVCTYYVHTYVFAYSHCVMFGVCIPEECETIHSYVRMYLQTIATYLYVYAYIHTYDD